MNLLSINPDFCSIIRAKKKNCFLINIRIYITKGISNFVVNLANYFFEINNSIISSFRKPGLNCVALIVLIFKNDC